MGLSFAEIEFNFHYSIFYYVLSFIGLFFVLEFYFKNKRTTVLQYFFCIVTLVCIILFFGNRDVLVGTDTVNNVKYFLGYDRVNNISGLNDIGLYSVSIFLSKFTTNVNHFLIALTILYVVPIFMFIINMKFINPFVFLVCFISFFFFKTMGINIQKQGIAFAFFLYGISCYFLNKRFLSYCVFFIAFLFHASIIIPITVFLISFRIKRISVFYYIYILATLFAVANVNVNNILGSLPIISILTESRLDGYYEDLGDYRIGFRFDFWTFNTIFAYIGYVTLKNIDTFKSSFISKYYHILYVCFLSLSSFFFLMFSARFNDRFGIMSWMFIPLLLFPYLQIPIKVKYINVLTVYILCFVLFTVFKIVL